MRPRVALFALCLAACQRTAPEPAPTLAMPSHGEHHADPSPPFALTVTSRIVDEGVAELKVRLTPAVALPSLTLGVDVGQSLAVVEGSAQRAVANAPAGAAVELRLRVRRSAPGAAGVTVRAWAEARDGATVLGDEQAVTLFGPPAVEQPSGRERIVRTPTGETLHDTLVD